MCAGAQSAFGAEWKLDPRVELQGLYDDNYTLVSDSAEKTKVNGALLDARVNIRAEDPTLKFHLSPEVRSSFLPGDSNLESTDELLNFGLQKEGRVSTTTVDGFYYRQTLLRNYLQTSTINSGLGQQDPNTTPGVLGRYKQDLFDINPGFTYRVTSRDGLQLNVGYLEGRYDRQAKAQGIASDFKNATALIGWDHSLSPLSTVSLRATGAMFDPRVGTKATTYGLQTEWRVQSSQIRQYYFRAGANRTSFDVNATLPIGTNRSATGFLAGAGVNWVYQVTQIFLDYTRDVAASGQGVVVNQDLLRFRLERRFTPRMAGFFGARATNSKAVGDVTGSYVNQKYATGTIGLEWRLTRTFSLIGGYDLTWLKYSNNPSGGRSNEVTISIVYEPHRLATDSAITLGN